MCASCVCHANSTTVGQDRERQECSPWSSVWEPAGSGPLEVPGLPGPGQRPSNPASVLGWPKLPLLSSLYASIVHSYLSLK